MSIFIKEKGKDNIINSGTKRDYTSDKHHSNNVKTGWIKGGDNAFGTYHLANNPQLYEIQRSNNFELVVNVPYNLLRAGNTRDIVGNHDTDDITFKNRYIGSEVAQEVLRMSVSDFQVPHFTQKAISVRRGNSEVKYAGVPTFNSGKLQLIDYIGADTLGVLMAWQNLSYNVRTERVGLASDYKLDAQLIEYAPDYNIVRTWQLKGCWISGISESDFSSESDDKRKISVDLEYDKAWLIWNVNSQR